MNNMKKSIKIIMYLHNIKHCKNNNKIIYANVCKTNFLKYLIKTQIT